MHALVTGSTGFVGRHLVRHLVACGDRVLGIDRRSSGTPGASGTPGTVAWRIDQHPTAAQRAEVAAFAPTHIFHLAAIAEPRRCAASGSNEPTPEAVQTNVTGTRHVLELASSLSPSPRVILASSSHVYAPVTRESPVVDETWPAEPSSAYGKTKLAAERLALEMAADRGLDVVIARSFSLAGPGQEPRYLLAELAAQLALAEVAAIRIQTRQAWLDLGDVRDAVLAYRLLAERGRHGETYNIGSGVNRSSGDVLAELLDVAGRPDLPVIELAPDANRVRQSAVASIAKITADTGWRPSRPLRETAADTLAACRAAPATLR